jgi:hypothetical protein
MVMYLSADELVSNGISDTNLWESRLDYQLVQEILGHDLSQSEWSELVGQLDDAVYEVVMSYQR